MTTRIITLIVAGAVVGCLATLAAMGITTSPVAPSGPDRSQAARNAAQAVVQGGYILHFRHGEREKWPAVIAFDVHETALNLDGREQSYGAAVCLTEQGIEESKMIGAIFELAHAEIGTVMASPSCRARQTAELAFGGYERTETALVHTPAFNADNRATFAAELADVYARVMMPAGSNAAIVAHGNTLEGNADMFVAGTEWLSTDHLGETGFYVIERAASGELSIVYRFNTIGDFAANAIDLEP